MTLENQPRGPFTERRPYTQLTHEQHGQITDIENGGWNVATGSLVPFKNYSKLKENLTTVGDDWRTAHSAYIVLDAIAAAVEAGQLHEEADCAKEIFEQYSDFSQLAADLCSSLNDEWMNERHYNALYLLMGSPCSTYAQVGAEMIDLQWPPQ